MENEVKPKKNQTNKKKKEILRWVFFPLNWNSVLLLFLLVLGAFVIYCGIARCLDAGKMGEKVWKLKMRFGRYLDAAFAFGEIKWGSLHN